MSHPAEAEGWEQVASLEVDKQAVLRDVQIREHPMWLRERATVESLIVAMRAIESPAALREWHAAMLEGVRRGEGLVADHRRRISTLRREVRGAPGPARRRWGSQMIEAVNYERDTVRALLAVLRTLADAVVWRMLDYNRAALAVLGEGQRVRHLSTGTGFAEEIATLERLWDEDGIPALMAATPRRSDPPAGGARAGVLEYVAANPGCTASNVAKALGSTGTRWPRGSLSSASGAT